MITVPGYLYIVLAGIAIALLGAVQSGGLRAGAVRVLGWLAVSLGVVLVILGVLLAVSP